MNRTDQFNSWIAAVESALTNAENTPIIENSCKCESWNCDKCFPSSDNTVSEDSNIEDELGSEAAELVDAPMESGDDIRDPELDFEMPDWDADPLAVKDWQTYQAGAPKTEQDVEHAMNMIGEILNAQSSGSSRSDQLYTEQELAEIGFDKLKAVHTEVMGINSVNESAPDADVINWLKRFDRLGKI